MKKKTSSKTKTRTKSSRSKSRYSSTRKAARPAAKRTIRARAKTPSRTAPKPKSRVGSKAAARTAVKRAAAAARTHYAPLAKPTAGTPSVVAPKAAAKLPTPPAGKTVARVAPRAVVSTRGRLNRPHTSRGSRSASSTSNANRHLLRISRLPQFTYMNAPGADSGFDVGDTVEVFCDHERDSERVRGWIKGVVVQVDNKLVAVQFRSNVFLTDGWMVPDRILWYALTSDQIRAATVGKKRGQRAIPDF